MSNGPGADTGTDAGSVPVNVTTLFGVEQHRGLVQVQVGDTSIIMDADDARTFGMFLLRCADAADTETALYRVMKMNGMTQQEFAQLLAQLREAYKYKTSAVRSD